MHENALRPATIGFLVGTSGALAFAVAISFFPESWFIDTTQRALLYAVQVPAGALFVLLSRRVGRAIRADDRQVLQGVLAGALFFDGLFIGFWPAVYGQEGFALTMTASVLLWAFAWIVIAAAVMDHRRSNRRA